METKAERDQRVMTMAARILRLPPADREACLLSTCGDDEDLYEEIADIVEGEERMGSFLRQPLIALADFNGPFAAGQIVCDRFEIIREVGQGGMGVVYEAFDNKRDQRIAIKAAKFGFHRLLSPELEGALKVRHPNVCLVNEIHTARADNGDTDFLTMEFLDGETLSARLARTGKFQPREVFEIARQLCSGLHEAHRSGVLHRDLKTANIMLCRADDGRARAVITDFGLAREMTLPSGELAGTPRYMSPELWREGKASPASDIYALGVILYEMLAGYSPFKTTDAADILISLKHKPEPPCRNRKLNRLVAKALAKQTSERYQTMDQVTQDLCLAGIGGGILNGAWFIIPLLAVLALCFFWLRTSWLKRSKQGFSIENSLPLTTSGNVLKAAVSPDGRYVAYVKQDQAGEALSLRQIDADTDSQIIQASTLNYTGLTFSRDSRSVYYVALQGGNLGVLYRVPINAGAAPTLVVKDVDSPISFSPDGSRFVFLRNHSALREISLMARTVGDGRESVLATLHAPDNFWPAPIWSPDAAFVVCGIFNSGDPGSLPVRIMTVRAADGKTFLTPSMPWYWMGKPVWLRGGRSIAVAAYGNESNHSRLWQVSIPDGKISPITHQLADYQDLDASADARRSIAIQADRRASIWLFPLAGGGAAPFTTAGRYYGIAWNATGNLISQTDIGGRPDLWTIDLQTKKFQRLTDDSFVEENPVASADGKYLVYGSNRDGAFHLWRSGQDGSHATQLTSGNAYEWEGTVTGDGNWVVYTSSRAGSQTLWKVSINGGMETQITKHHARNPSVSPDGTLIACRYFSGPEKGWSTVALRANREEIVRTYPEIPSDETPLRWSPDGRQLFFVRTEGGVSNIWNQPADGGISRQLTHFSEGLIFSFSLSSDGRSLAILKGTAFSDVVLLQGQGF